MELLTTAQVAELVSIHPATLRGWRMHGEGPKWVRVGKATIRYRRSDLDNWMASLGTAVLV